MSVELPLSHETMNKDAWSQGPWTDEPDEEIFKHAGLLCRIIRHGRSGHLCGYVRVPEWHPLHGKGYSDVVPEFDVHGGLTFSGELDGLDGHWFGFDCAHAGDLQPNAPYSFEYDAVYRDIEYVRAECRSLAEQLAALAATVPAKEE